MRQPNASWPQDGDDHISRPAATASVQGGSRFRMAYWGPLRTIAADEQPPPHWTKQHRTGERTDLVLLSRQARIRVARSDPDLLRARPLEHPPVQTRLPMPINAYL